MSSDPPATGSAAADARRTLWLLSLLSALAFMDRQILAVLTEPVKAEFALSDLHVGLVTGLGFSVCFGILALPLGRYADRHERRGLVAWCRGIGGALAALGALAPGAGWLMATRAGAAVSDAGGGPASMSMIADLYPPERRSGAMSVFTMGASAGSLMALVGGAWLMQHFGWRATLLAVGLPALALALLLRWVVKEPMRVAHGAGVGLPAAPNGSSSSTGALTGPRVASASEPAAPLGAVAEVWSNTVARRLLIAGAFALIAGYSFGTWNFAYLMRLHGFSPMGAGWVSGAAALGSVVGGLFAGRLTDRLVRRDRRWQMGVPLLGLSLALPAGWLYLTLPPGNAGWVAAMVTSFAFLIAFWVAPTYAALSMVVPPHRRATANALMMLAGALLGGGLGPVLTGGLSDLLTPWAHGDALRWSLAAVIGLLGGAMWFMAHAMRSYAGSPVPSHTPAGGTT
jgi:MFS family permease